MPNRDLTAKRVLTVQEFAEAFAMREKTVRQLIRQERIRAVNVGTDRCRRYRIPLSEVARIERQGLTF